MTRRPCPMCGGGLVEERVAGVACLACHAPRCLGFDQSYPTVFVLLGGRLERRRHLERELARRLDREQKIES